MIEEQIRRFESIMKAYEAQRPFKFVDMEYCFGLLSQCHGQVPNFARYKEVFELAKLHKSNTGLAVDILKGFAGPEYLPIAQLSEMINRLERLDPKNAYLSMFKAQLMLHYRTLP